MPQPDATKPAATKPAAVKPAVAGSAQPAAAPATTPRPPTNGSAPKPAPVATTPQTADVSAAEPGDASTHEKPSFWSRIAEGLGIEKKTEEAPVAAADSTPVTTPVATATAPTAPAKAGPAPTTTPSPKAFPVTGKPAPGPAVPAGAPANPGPQFRQAQTGPQNRTPANAPVQPVPAPGQVRQPAPGVRGGATAVVPAVGAGAATESLAAGATPRPVTRRTRKARLRLSRLDPWSVMKTSFLFSIAAGIMLVVAVYGIWLVLSASGLFGSLNDIVGTLTSNPGDTTPFRIEDYVNTQRVMGVAALVACIDVLIFTALATLGSFLYNLAATMLGGLEITLAED
ncbi:DUF3566 domain-containing protein [uncultured Friedmanniella sp.]|uniref:DUF3566 domain-containing protein n=1 Tax=uncultured Friedmanniella sp. TaxID=335381 RepID=UPI0035CA05AC